MAMIRHPSTGLPMGDPDRIPLMDCDLREIQAQTDEALRAMILSASGWRGIFASQGDEESKTQEIKAPHMVIVAMAARVYADFLRATTGEPSPTIILGIDSRPTGPAIADVMIRAFLAARCTLRYCYIATVPEIMAYTRSSVAAGFAQGFAQGFAYVSASHNPIGHNGLKFGLSDGSVLSADKAAILIQEFRTRMAQKDCVQQTATDLRHVDREEVAQVYTQVSLHKREAYSAYLLFTHEVVTGKTELEEQKQILDAITNSTAKQGLGVVVDFNGSARTTSLDVDFLSSLGLSVRTINAVPAAIAHRIVPEGSSLQPCRMALDEAHSQDKKYILGYVPDCDGDRGNLVIWDDNKNEARSLEAQEVFALCCIAELSYLVWSGGLRFDKKGNALDKVAVAVNDPTSMRVDRIAAAFDATVFRAEVGEANVVNLARRLRDKGYAVRILGEGSAGGNITHPSSVRDPIATVSAIVKLLTLRREGDKEGLFELWCKLSDQEGAYHEAFTLSDIIATLPAFITTSVYTEKAVLRIETEDHTLLKNRYQRIFLKEWDARKEELRERYDIADWEAIAYNGLEERRSLRSFGEAGRGGLKILFKDSGGRERNYIWMRGSGTEPVLRIMADAEGQDPRVEQDLLLWQRRMVQEADKNLADTSG